MKLYVNILYRSFYTYLIDSKILLLSLFFLGIVTIGFGQNSFATYTANTVKDGDAQTITVTFDGVVSGTPTIELSGAETVSATAMTDSGDQTTWTYNDGTTHTGDGTVTITLGGIATVGGSPINTTPTNNTFTIDNTAPRITSIVRQSPASSPTNADVLVWDVTFNGTVNNVDAADFTASGTTATVQSAVDQGSNVYRVTVSGGDLASLNATVTLGFDGAQNITDPVGNALTNLTPTGTNDNTFVVDNTAPRITSIVRQSPASSPTNADVLVWDVTFNGTVNNVDVADFTASGTTATVQSAVDQGSNVYRVTVSGGDLASLNATVTLGFDGAQNITDPVGNALTNLTPTGTNNNTFVVDNTSPSFSSGTVENITKNQVVATFDSNITLSDATGFSVGITSAGPILSVSGSGTTQLTFTLTGNVISGDGITLIYNGSGDAVDAAGNGLNTFNTGLTNNVAPLPISAEVNDGTPKIIEVTFDDNITISTTTGFNVVGINGENFNGGISGSGTKVINFDMGNRTVSAGDIITLDYDGGSDAVNGSTIALSTFSGLSITNNIAVKPAPGNFATNFTATEASTTSINLVWDYIEVGQIPENYIIIGKDVTAGGTYASVINGTPVANDSDWSDGNFAINLVYPDNAETISGLTSGHNYQFRIYPYTNSGASIAYNTDTDGTQEDSQLLTTSANTTITGGTGVASLSSLVDTKAEATATNFEFVIDDDGASDGVDSAPTLINQIVIQRDVINDLLDWTTVIAGVIFEDNGVGTLNSTDNPTDVVITSSAITISNIPNANTTDLGYVADNGTKTYSLKVWLKNNISSAITIDEKKLVFEVAHTDITVETTAPLSSDIATSSVNSGTSNNTMNVVATKLIWVDFPASVAGAHIEFDVTVKAVDANNNIDVGVDNTDVYMYSISSSDPDGDFESDGPSNQGNELPIKSVLQNGQFTATRCEFHRAGNYVVEARTPTWDGPWDLTTAQTPSVNVGVSDNESDIIATTFSPPDNIAYNLYQATNITNVGEGIKVGEFTIRDGGADGIDLDITDTDLNSITFDLTNSTSIRQVALFVGTTLIESKAGAASITFSGISGVSATDGGGGTPTISLYVSFVSSVTDNTNFQFRITSVDASGSTFAFTDGASGTGGAVTPLVLDDNRIEVSASKLVFTTEPSTTAFTIANLVQSPEVSALDELNNLDLDYNSSAIGQISNAGSLPMNNIPTTYINGVMTFPANLQYTEPGNGTLTVTDINNVLTQAVSNTVTISVDNETDIIDNIAFVYPTNIVYQNYREADINGDGFGDIEVAQFDIREGGADFVDADGSATELTEITFDVTNHTNIKNMALYNGAVELGEVAASATTTFTGLNVLTAEGSSTTLRLFVTFNDLVTDNDQFGFTVNNVVTNSIRSSMTTANAGGAVSSTIGDNNRIEVTASQLVFTQQPPAIVNALVNVSPSPVVQAHDALNNIDVDFVEAVLSITNARATPQIPMSNLPSGPFAFGELAFPSNFQYTEPSFLTGDAALTVSTTSFITTSTGVTSVVSELSDIIEDATFTYPTNIDYLPYDVETDLLKIAQFTITDGGDGNGNDNDNADTELTSLTLNFANHTSIRQVAIYENNTIKSDVKTLDASGNVTFNSGDVLPLSITANDNNIKTFNIRVNFQTAVKDNEQFTVEITAASTNLLKSRFATANAGGAITTLGVDDNKMEVVATDVVFTTNPHPTNISTFTNIDSPYIIVEAQDINFNTDLDYTSAIGSVTTQNFVPTNLLTMQNDPTGNFTAGVYDFQVKAPTWQFTSDGELGELVVSASGLTNGVSNTFSVAASEESFVKLVSSPANVMYLGFHDDVITDVNSVEIARFRLIDGTFGGVGFDVDGADTEIDQLIIAIENHTSLKQIGVFIDGTSTPLGDENNQASATTLIWNNLGIIAPDNGHIDFVIRASFPSAIIDNTPINVSITSVTEAGGSKFPTTEPDRTNATVVATSDIAGNNLIEVVASKFIFDQQPSPLEGIGIDWAGGTDPYPLVTAYDANNNVDLDIDETFVVSGSNLVSTNTQITAPVGVSIRSGFSIDFIDGVLDLTNMDYNTFGDGTITITDIGGAGIASDVSNTVAVVHTEATQLTSGIQDPAIPLISGQGNIFIFGFGLEAFNDTGAEPILNEFTLRFKNPDNIPFNINSIFENFRIFRSLDNSIDATLTNTTSIGFGIINTAGDAVTFSGLNEFIDDQSGNPGLDNQYYFIIVDVGVNADEATPILVPYITGNDVVVSNGSSVTSGIFIDNEYSFSDPRKPELDIANLVPADDDITVDVNTPFIVAFDESVVSLDEVITLRIQGIDEATFSPKLEIAASNPYSLDSTQVTFEYVEYIDHDADPITPLQRTLKSLEPETNYYITIAPGDKNIVSLAGFRDESTSQNLYDGHSSNTIWNFRTADITPPVMSAISISNIDDQGFSFSLDLDEKGKVYYIVVDPSVGGFVAPTGTQVFAQDNTVTGFLAMGTFDVLLPNKQHVNFINGLATNTDFQVYAMAEDVGLVQMNNIDIGISTLNTTAGSSTSGVTIIAPELPICEGDIQPQISPLVIREGVDTDFTNGSHSMILGINSDDFVFENGVTPDFSLSSAGLSNFITTYISSSIIQITYDVSSTASQRDQIVVSGFRFQSINGGSTAAVVKLAGGTSDFIPNINLINLVGYNSVANATFKFDPDVTSVGNLQSALTIEPDPSLILGTNEFYGNGVFFDTGINKYKFNPSTAGNTTHTITLSHTDVNQCVANGIKTITVFDENNSIIDLQEKYCLSGDKATGFDTQEVLISATSQDGFRLDTLWLNTDDLAGAIPGAYKANIDPTTGVLIASGNDYLFYPNIAAKDSVDQSSVALQFIGRYVNIFNVADTIELKKVVSISDAPTIFSFTSNISPLSGNTVDFCEDDVDIILTGEIDRAIHSDAEEIIEMVEWSVGSYVPITNNFSSLSDNNAGVGTVFPQIVFNNRSSFPDLTKNIYQYYVRNNITTCESTDTISINVNPKPIASFTDITGCEGQEVKFTNSSTLDGVNLGEFDVNSWQWTVDNENFIGDNSSFEPTETFAVSRNYSIRLDVTTKKGCIDDSIKVIQVGAIPSVDFSYTGVNVIDTFTFTSTTTLTSGLNVSSNIDHLASIRWKFEEGTEFTETGNAGGINHIATHKFNTPLVNYDSISLYAVSSYNCTDSLKLPIIVLQNVVVDSVKGITETDPDGLWVPWSANGSGSWERAVDINTGSELVWVTNANSVYTANDKSYVYSPTYNLSALKRPLIEAEAFWNLEESDGVAFQYSTDNYNVTDSRKSWAILGSTSTDGSKNSGISWYNAINILASPGEQTTNDYGWTGNHTADENKLFTTAKHSLNELLNKSNVTFRMAFSSADRIAAIQAQGFAFNNVRIGERTRTVLLENFTNTNAVNYIKEKDYIDIDFVNNAKEGVEAVIINYHTDFPEPDVFNLLNQVAPSARAAFYNVNSVPYAVLDGDASKNTTDGYFSKWGIDEFQRRSLQLADYQISAVIDQPTDKDDVIITVTLEKNITAPENINNGLLHVALVENSMSEGGITAQYVLKHMLPSATGTFIPVAEMNNGAFTKVITWTPGSTSANTGTTNFEDIEVVIFLQDEINKTIYQAIVVPLINKGINLVTSTDEYFEQNTLTLYPNPARHFTQLDFGKVIEDDYQVKVYDQFGKLIFNDNISKGQRVYELDTKNYLNSLYIIQIESDNEVIERTKLVILE